MSDKKKRSIWYERHDAELRRLLVEGVELAEMSSSLGRSESSITRRIAKLRIDDPSLQYPTRLNRVWTSEDTATLTEYLRTRTPIHVVAMQMRRAKTTILAKIKELNVPRSPQHTEWSEDDTSLLIELVARGWSTARIARKLGRTRGAIYARLSLLRSTGPRVVFNQPTKPTTLHRDDLLAKLDAILNALKNLENKK